MKVDSRHRPTVDGLPQDGVTAVVWKHEIPIFTTGANRQVSWPADAQVVHVAPHPDRADVVLVWTMHTERPDRPLLQRFRWIRVFGTGEPIPAPCAHLGTAVTRFGVVWHLVEIL